MAQEWTPPPASGSPASVPNYLIPAIISLFCCLPLGIVGVIFAALTGGALADFQRGELAKWGKAVRDSGAAVDQF